MKRFFTMTCLAASFAVGLAAQSTTTGTAGQEPPGGQRGPGPRTVTGCLRAGDTAGSYMLTDVVMQGGGGRRGADATGSTTATGTTSTGTTATGTTAQGGAPMPPQSIMLNAGSDVDLKPHVGHKVEVTGTMAGGGRRGGDATTTGSTATGGTTTGSTATGTTTGGTTAAGGTTATGGQGRGGARSMTITNVRMISESCS